MNRTIHIFSRGGGCWLGIAPFTFVLVTVLLGGCNSPSHTARFSLDSGQTMTLRPEGEKPTVELAPGFGPLKEVVWWHENKDVSFHGVAPGGMIRLTVYGGDTIDFTSESDCDVYLKLWDATGYTLEKPSPRAVHGETAAR